MLRELGKIRCSAHGFVTKFCATHRLSRLFIRVLDPSSCSLHGLNTKFWSVHAFHIRVLFAPKWSSVPNVVDGVVNPTSTLYTYLFPSKNWIFKTAQHLINARRLISIIALNALVSSGRWCFAPTFCSTFSLLRHPYFFICVGDGEIPDNAKCTRMPIKNRYEFY